MATVNFIYLTNGRFSIAEPFDKVMDTWLDTEECVLPKVLDVDDVLLSCDVGNKVPDPKPTPTPPPPDIWPDVSVE